MNLRKALIIFLAILPPLLLTGCGGKDPINELPPPPTPNGGEQGGEQGGNGGGTETHPWDANRGKVVTPSGTGWTKKTIDDGVVYYTFSGKDELTSDKAMEEVFVIDLDLKKTQYQAKLLFTEPTVVVSDAFKQNSNTIAAMNANYEVKSIYVRVDGSTKYQIPNITIGDTDVPNWKSEAAFTSNGEQGLGIVFAGSPARDGKIKGIQGKSYAEAVSLQRQFYNSIASSNPHLISSAPMLIDDYEPVGENFCDYSLSTTQVNKLNGEDPNRHQRVRHPRTAVALTENNHFLMVVVDGRQTSKGMSARELTKFLVKWFNPQYALNMDGGGSSTLCVKGEGDPETHVVNYPCDNNTYDHAGERKRNVHFVILKK